MQIKTDKNLKDKYLTLSKFIRDTAEKIRRHRMDMCIRINTYLSSSKFVLDRYEIYFVCAEVRIIICRLLTNENTGI